MDFKCKCGKTNWFDFTRRLIVVDKNKVYIDNVECSGCKKKYDLVFSLTKQNESEA